MFASLNLGDGHVFFCSAKPLIEEMDRVRHEKLLGFIDQQAPEQIIALNQLAEKLHFNEDILRA